MLCGNSLENAVGRSLEECELRRWGYWVKQTRRTEECDKDLEKKDVESDRMRGKCSQRKWMGLGMGLWNFPMEGTKLYIIVAVAVFEIIFYELLIWGFSTSICDKYHSCSSNVSQPCNDSATFACVVRCCAWFRVESWSRRLVLQCFTYIFFFSLFLASRRWYTEFIIA